MSYEIDIDLPARDDIAALPATALPALAEAMTILELTPWNGHPINPDNPDGTVRTLHLRLRRDADLSRARRRATRRRTDRRLGELTEPHSEHCWAVTMARLSMMTVR